MDSRTVPEVLEIVGSWFREVDLTCMMTTIGKDLRVEITLATYHMMIRSFPGYQQHLHHQRELV